LKKIFWERGVHARAGGLGRGFRFGFQLAL